jgi:hypothetical protein
MTSSGVMRTILQQSDSMEWVGKTLQPKRVAIPKISCDDGAYHFFETDGIKRPEFPPEDQTVKAACHRGFTEWL